MNDLFVHVYTCPHCDYSLKIVDYKSLNRSYDCGHFTPKGDAHKLTWQGSYAYEYFPEHASKELGDTLRES